METRFRIHADKNITPDEYAELMASVGWGGDESSFSTEVVERSLAAYPFIAYARDRSGRLAGYISAFSDGAFSTFIGELVVRPEARRLGLGSELLKRVEAHYPRIPIYAQTFLDVQQFFIQRGYKTAQRPMGVVFKIPG